MRDAAQSFSGFRVYPRGFLGASLGVNAQTALRPYHERIQSHVYHPDMLKRPKLEVEINRNVEKIWSRFLGHEGALWNFEFRETVLKIALGAFGTEDFKQWVDVQFKGPATGELHADFIYDTLNFIQTGQRKLTLMNWIPMLTLSEAGSNITVADKEIIKSFFIDSRNGLAKNIKLVDVLQRWCSHPGGFEDLVQSLHVLFGDIVP